MVYFNGMAEEVEILFPQIQEQSFASNTVIVAQDRDFVKSDVFYFIHSLCQGSAPMSIYVVKRGFLRLVRRMTNNHEETGNVLSKVGSISRNASLVHRCALLWYLVLL